MLQNPLVFISIKRLKPYPRILSNVGVGVVEDLVWFAVFEEFTICGEDDAVGYLAGKSHLVGNDDHGHALLC